MDGVAPDRVIHGLESNLVFGNTFGPPSNHVLNGADTSLFQAISGYWTRFASTGNPNVDDETVVHWSAMRAPEGNGRGAGKYLVLQEVIDQARRLHERECDFWEPYYFRSTIGVVPASYP